MFIEQRQVGQMAVFAYLVGDEVSGEALVIDPAADTDGIIAAAEKNKVRIKYIVNTHGHVDHIGGNLDIRKATGAGIIIHEDDAEMLVATPATMLRMFGAKQSPPADRTVRDGDLIEVGGVRLRVLHTPGHSPGSVCFLYGKHLVAGDTIFPGGPGHTHTPEDFRRIVRSIQEKVFPMEDDTAIYPDHGEATVLAREKAEYAMFSARPHPPDLCGDVLWLSS